MNGRRVAMVWFMIQLTVLSNNCFYSDSHLICFFALLHSIARALAVMYNNSYALNCSVIQNLINSGLISLVRWWSGAIPFSRDRETRSI
jgi:hypothetical protein